MVPWTEPWAWYETRIIWLWNENKDECFHGLQFDPFNEFYFAGYNKIGAGSHRVRIWDIRKISTTTVNTHSVAEKIFDQPIKKIQYSPVRWGFLGILTGMAGEGKIHVIENHLASNDNEEDVIFDQVDFKGMRFLHHVTARPDFPGLGHHEQRLSWAWWKPLWRNKRWIQRFLLVNNSASRNQFNFDRPGSKTNIAFHSRNSISDRTCGYHYH